MRGRMALLVSDLNYQHREVLLRDKPAHMLSLSPKGTVPVFLTEDRQVIDESLDLMLWALNQADPFHWLEGDPQIRDVLIKANDGPFKYHLDRYKYASRFSSKAERGDVDISHRQKAEAYLEALERRLETSENLLGFHPTLADIAIFPFIRQFANTDREWWLTSAYANLRAWLDHHTNSIYFETIMQKFPLWQESGDKIDQI